VGDIGWEKRKGGRKKDNCYRYEFAFNQVQKNADKRNKKRQGGNANDRLVNQGGSNKLASLGKLGVRIEKRVVPGTGTEEKRFSEKFEEGVKEGSRRVYFKYFPKKSSERRENKRGIFRKRGGSSRGKASRVIHWDMPHRTKGRCASTRIKRGKAR